MNLCTSDWAHWDAPQFKGVQRPTQRGQSLYVPLRIKAGEAPSLGVEKRLLGRRRILPGHVGWIALVESFLGYCWLHNLFGIDSKNQ